jgi:hypothetical protein
MKRKGAPIISIAGSTRISASFCRRSAGLQLFCGDHRESVSLFLSARAIGQGWVTHTALRAGANLFGSIISIIQIGQMPSHATKSTNLK